MDTLKHTDTNKPGAAGLGEQGPYRPSLDYGARLDFEAWCWHRRNSGGETGEAARFVLNDLGRGCWPETRRLGPFHRTHRGRGAQGREDLFVEHLVAKHGAGLDSPLVALVVRAHRLYLEDMRRFWWHVEHHCPGPPPGLDAVLDFSGRCSER